MKNNPVYRREVTVRSRSFRLPLVILIFNTILAVFSLFSMYSTVAQVRVSAQVSYESFLQLYAFAATLEFLLLMFIMPALTSGSVSGERERQTLELLLTTKMTAADIVTGKLMAAFDQMGLLVMSSFPIILLTFVYGSADIGGIALLLVCFATTAAFCGGIGILASSVTRRSTFSNVCTYGFLLLIVIGTLMLNQFVLQLSEMRISEAAYQFGAEQTVADTGAAVYLLLLNPFVTFAEILSGQISGGSRLFSLSAFLGARPENFVTGHWTAISLCVQAALSVLFVRGAVRSLGKNRRT